MRLREKIKRLLASTLALTTVITALPSMSIEAGIDITVPSSLTVDYSKVAFSVVVEGVVYDEETMSGVVGEHMAGYYTTTFDFKPEDGATTKEIDISSVYDSVLSYCNKTDLSELTRGIANISSSDSRVTATLTDNDTKLLVDIQPDGEDFGSGNNIYVRLPFYFNHDLLESDFEFNGTYNRGFTKEVKYNNWRKDGGSWTIPSIDNIHNPNKKPILVVTDYDYSATGLYPTAEVVWLASTSVHNDTDSSEWYPLGSESAYNNFQGYDEYTKTFDLSGITWDTDKYGDYVLEGVSVEKVSNPNATASVDPDNASYVDITSTKTVDGISYPTSLTLKVKSGNYIAADPSLEDSYYSDCFGMNAYDVFIVKYKGILDKNLTKTIQIDDYYNVFNNDKDNAQFVGTVKTWTQNGVDTVIGTVPSTNVDGWYYVNSTNEILDNITGTENGVPTLTSHRKIYRYFVQTESKTFSYNLKYKVVWADGTPAEGLVVTGTDFAESTDSAGYIAHADKFTVQLDEVVPNSENSEESYAKQFSLNPSLAGTLTVDCNNVSHQIDYSYWGAITTDIAFAGQYPALTSGLPKNFGVTLTEVDDYLEITKEDAYNYVCIIKLNRNKVETTEYTIPVTINYKAYDKVAWSSTTVDTDTFDIKVISNEDGSIPQVIGFGSRPISDASLDAVKAELNTDSIELYNAEVAYTACSGDWDWDKSVPQVDLDNKLVSSYIKFLDTVSDSNLKSDIGVLVANGIEVNVSFSKKIKGVATIHFKDTEGNTIKPDVTIIADNGSNTDNFYVDSDINGYQPTGEVEGQTSSGESVIDLNSSMWSVTDYVNYSNFWHFNFTSDPDTNSDARYKVSAKSNPINSEDLDVTIEYVKLANVNFFRVDNYDYSNATYIDTISINPTIQMTMNGKGYDAVNRVECSYKNNIWNVKYYFPDFDDYGEGDLELDGITKTAGATKDQLKDYSIWQFVADGDDIYICFRNKYKINVYDDLYDSTGTLEKHNLRATYNYFYGTNYSFSKVNKSGYEFKGTSPISGVVTEDKDIIFSYYAPSVEVDVIDKYLNAAGSTQRKKLRLSDTMAVGSTYSYNALNPTGYSLVGDSTQSGTADTDTTLTFTYRQAPEYRTITVHDAYYESDGTTLIKTEDRDVETVLKGSTYNVDAKTVAGYEVFGNTSYSGTANSNVEVTFTYKKIPSYTVTVIDEYQSSEGVVTSSVTRSTDTYVRDSAYSYNALSPIGYTLQTATPQTGTVTGNLTVKFVYKANAFTITVIDEYLDANGAVESSNTRLTDTQDFGYNYSYSALAVPTDSQLMTDATQSGVLTDNVEIKFIYKKLKSFTITVEDKYIKADGTVDHIDTRLTDTVLENVAYSYNALDPVPTGYVLTSEATYSGVATQDLTITFTYTDNTARFVTVKGYITYADGTPIANKVIEIHSSPRTTTTDANGYYEIDNVEVGDHTFTIFEDAAKTIKLATADIVVSTPNNDTVTVTFKDTDTEVNTDTSQSNVLKIDAILPLYNLKVVDEYYTDGSLEKSETRVDTTLKKGDTYSYSALSPDGYTLEGSATYTGTIVENTVLTFKYVKTTTPPVIPPVTPTSYTLTVKDEYYIDGVLNKSAVRETKSVILGESYNYNALSPVGYTVEGNTNYSGTITGNLTLVFKYVKTTSTPVVNTYKVTVIDKYYRNDDSLESVSTRCVDTYTEGSSYSYDALIPASYTVTSAKSFSGVVNSDITVTFTYKKDKEPEKPTYVTIKVIDNYFDSSSVLQDSVLRVETIVTSGTSYDYQALNPSGYIVSGDTRYTGKATSNVTINFNYVQKEDEPTKYTITVIDEFYDAEGSLESADTRLVDTIDAGYIYSYNAINRFGYKVTGVSNYTGVANSDLILTFTYQKETKKLKDYTITVIDRYITNTPVPERYTVTEQHTTDDIHYETKINTITNNESVVTVTRIIRCSDTHKEGSNYYYEALSPSGYEVIGNKAYSGIVDRDLTLEFVYAKGFDNENDIPEDIEIPEPVNKDKFPEPKTGDTSLPWIPVIPVVVTVLGVIIYKKKRK